MNLLNNYTVFTEDNIQKIFELSPSRECSHYTIGELRYGIIKNFYKDPVAVKEFWENIPLFASKVSNSPGIQSYFPSTGLSLLKNIFEYLYSVLESADLPRCMNPNKTTPEVWNTYCNYYWKSMNGSRSSAQPHYDDFNLGFNVWLSEDIPGGTDFFTYKYKDYKPVKYIADFNDQAKTQQVFTDFYHNVDNNYEGDEKKKYESIKKESPVWDPENDINPSWEKWHTIDAEYNSCTFYPGIFFHRPSVNPKDYSEDFLRHSQVFSYNWGDMDKFQNEYKHYARSSTSS